MLAEQRVIERIPYTLTGSFEYDRRFEKGLSRVHMQQATA